MEKFGSERVKARRRTENIQELKEKPLYGQFARQCEEQGSEETWAWLTEAKLKRETEALIIAAQADQAVRTNYIKTMVDKSQNDHKCRICEQNNETISHIVISCSKLAKRVQKEA